MYLSGQKFTLRTGHKPLQKMTLPHSFWQQHAFSIGPYSFHHTSVKLNSSLLLKWPPPMLCPGYHSNTGSMPASRPNLPGVNGASNQTHFSVLETARQTVWNPVLAMTQNVWPTHFCTTPALKRFLLRKDELSVEQGCLMWGLWTIPPSSQEQILSELNKVHPGVAWRQQPAVMYGGLE